MGLGLARALGLGVNLPSGSGYTSHPLGSMAGVIVRVRVNVTVRCNVSVSVSVSVKG